MLELKSKAKESQTVKAYTFNRTMLELKYCPYCGKKGHFYTFNRTMLELKYNLTVRPLLRLFF